jgi:hypothetical protein
MGAGLTMCSAGEGRLLSAHVRGRETHDDHYVSVHVEVSEPTGRWGFRIALPSHPWSQGDAEWAVSQIAHLIPEREPDHEDGPTRTDERGGIYHCAPTPGWAAWHARISAIPRGTPGIPEYLHDRDLAVWYAIDAHAASLGVPRQDVERACHDALRARPRQPWSTP